MLKKEIIIPRNHACNILNAHNSPSYKDAIKANALQIAALMTSNDKTDEQNNMHKLEIQNGIDAFFDIIKDNYKERKNIDFNTIKDYAKDYTKNQIFSDYRADMASMQHDLSDKQINKLNREIETHNETVYSSYLIAPELQKLEHFKTADGRNLSAFDVLKNLAATAKNTNDMTTVEFDEIVCSEALNKSKTEGFEGFIKAIDYKQYMPDISKDMITMPGGIEIEDNAQAAKYIYDLVETFEDSKELKNLFKTTDAQEIAKLNKQMVYATVEDSKEVSENINKIAEQINEPAIV